MIVNCYCRLITFTTFDFVQTSDHMFVQRFLSPTPAGHLLTRIDRLSSSVCFNISPCGLDKVDMLLWHKQNSPSSVYLLG